ncbi:GNAT family N-acetyltransferase [bacterium]|nr:GNAT family N-acetyltransferase [bacterium]
MMALSNSQKSIDGVGACCSILTADWRDYTQLNRLEKASFRREDNWPFWDLIGILTMPGLVRLKAILDGQMVGFVGGERETAKRLGWITTLAVLPDYRRRGIAQVLLDQAEEELAMPRIRLSVRASNKAAIKLYETTGYQQVDRWEKYYAGGEDALVFEKGR